MSASLHRLVGVGRRRPFVAEVLCTTYVYLLYDGSALTALVAGMWQ